MKRKPITDKTILDAIGVSLKKKPTEQSIVMDLDLDAVSTSQGIRFAAKMAYVTSLRGISFQKMTEIPLFSKLHVSQLSKWSVEDGWVVEREKYRTKLEKKILAKLSAEHIDSIVNQLKDADDLAAKMNLILREGSVAPRSFEGMVNALMKLEEFRFNSREKIAALLASQIQEREDEDTLLETVVTPKVDYNKEVLMKMAHAIIKRERNGKPKK